MQFWSNHQEYSVKENNTKEQLTTRQKEVISLISDGYTAQETSQILDISIFSVMAHRNIIRLKLDIHDVACLVKYVVKNNLTTLDSHRSNPKLPN